MSVESLASHAKRKRAVVVVARGRVLALETSEADVGSASASVVTHTDVPEAGWLRSLTRGDRFVRAEDGTGVDDTSVGVAFVKDPGSDDPAGDFDTRMKRYYGYAFVEARALAPLP